MPSIELTMCNHSFEACRIAENWLNEKLIRSHAWQEISCTPLCSLVMSHSAQMKIAHASDEFIMWQEQGRMACSLAFH